MTQRKNASVNGEWLDNHTWIPVAFLILLPFLVELPLFCLGYTTDPMSLGSDTVYHAPAGRSIIGTNPKATTIDGNIGGQLQALGHLSASEWAHGRVPWWNHYSGIGLPLAGEMQPASFFLPFIFLLLLNNGILWLSISMQILAGLATFSLLRTLELGRLAALVGGALFSLNGTFAWLSGMVGNTVPFLPLLIYGMELAYRNGLKGNGALWIAISIFGSLTAGFPESSYINGLFALTWVLYRFKGSPSRSDFISAVIYGGFLGLMLGSPLLVAFVDFIKTTDIVAIHKAGHAVLKPPVLTNIFLPYSFGSIYYAPQPNWNILVIWGSNGGYESIVIAFMALLGLQGRRERGLRWLLLLWIVICMAASFGVAPFHGIVNKLPFMADVNLARYSSATWEFAFTVLAAMALDDLKYISIAKRWALVITALVITACTIFGWPANKLWGWQPHAEHVMRALMCGVLAIVLASIGVMLAIFHFEKGEARRYGISMLLIFTASWTFMVPESAALKSEPDAQAGIGFIQRTLGLARFFTLGKIQPNYSAYFRIPSINHAYCPVDKNWASYVESNLFPDAAKTAGGAFIPGGWFSYSPDDGQAALSKYGDNYKQAAVRYVVAGPSQSILNLIAPDKKDSGASSLELAPNQAANFSLEVPAANESSYPLSIIGVSQAQYPRPEVMAGDVQITVCVSQDQCVAGHTALSFSHPGRSIWIPLDETLNVRPGDQLTVSLKYVNGTAKLALLTTSTASPDRELMTPQGRIMGETIKTRMGYGHDMAGMKQVYSDLVMDIWELPDVSPYYSVLNGSCVLSNASLDSVDAECASPAKLLRRELYVDGWRAMVNQHAVPVSGVNDLFQSIELPAGRNSIRFQFSPPHVQYAWMLFWLGALGLMLECRKYLRHHASGVLPS